MTNLYEINPNSKATTQTLEEISIWGGEVRYDGVNNTAIIYFKDFHLWKQLLNHREDIFQNLQSINDCKIIIQVQNYIVFEN